MNFLYIQEIVGKVTFKYADPHPTEGFIVIHRQTRHLPESYFILTRPRDPRIIEEAMKQALRALGQDIGDFFVKSKDFGNIGLDMQTSPSHWCLETSLNNSNSSFLFQVVKGEKRMELSCKKENKLSLCVRKRR